MGSARRHSPLDIFQDADASFADHQFHTDPTVLQPSSANLSHPNLLIEPPFDQHTYLSPLKQSSPKSSPPAAHLPQPDFFDTIHLDTPNSAHVLTDSVLKKASPTMFYQAVGQHAPQKALFNTSSAPRPVEKENFYAPPFYDRGMPSSDAPQGYPSVLGKRQPSETPRDSHVKKQKVEDEDDEPLPDPQDLPSFNDDGTKPPYSYASLIGFAILRAPNRRLTLSQIYKWISDTFSHYKEAEAGWTNSIRHNLSLNKAFVKKERPKDEPGKGNYWTIEEGMERQFLKEKPVRRSNITDPPPYFQPIHSDGQRPSTAPHIGAFSLPPRPPRNIDTSRFPAENEISSDATLPASDDAAPPGEDHDQRLMPPPPRALHSSPPPAEIGSSPPVALPEINDDTPPPRVRFSSMSRSGTRTKHIDAFRDSGFYSSIESSATRPAHGPTTAIMSDVDQQRPRKSGRAEEEIARIRGSSYDPSPTKNKPVFKHPSILASSSPLRSGGHNAFPLTPGLHLKPPRQAPPSVSPMTHLRRHRENVRDLVGTPANGRSHLADDGIYSPSFNIHDDNGNEFDVYSGPTAIQPPSIFDFQNTNTLLDDETFESFFARGSPVRNSVKRPILKRATTTAGILSDVTNSGRANSNLRLGSPITLLPPGKAGRSKLGSPMKRGTPPGEDSGPETPKMWKDDDIWKSMIHSDEEQENPSDGEDGVDLLKGFQSIGATAAGMQEGKENEVPRTSSHGKPQQQKSAAKRPALGRSVTNVI